MNKKRVYLAIFALVLFTIIATAAHAALLDPILRPLSRLDPVPTYNSYWYIIDTILYFIILMGAAQVGLGQRMQGSGGRAVIIAVGIALSLGATLGARTLGFRLGNFWPLALVMVILAIGFAVYNYFRHIAGVQNRAFAMLGFAFLFYYFTSAVPGLANYFRNSSNPYLQLMWAVLELAAIVCLIWGLIDLVRGVSNWAGGGGGRGNGGGGGAGDRRTGGERGRGPLRRAWDWLTGRGNQDENQGGPNGDQLDHETPGTVNIRVVDLQNNPIEGARCYLTGRNSSILRHLPGWRNRPWFREEHTDNRGLCRLEGVPSGQLRLQVNHPNYEWWRMKIGTRANLTHQFITLPQNGEVNVTVTLRRISDFGVLSGRVVSEAACVGVISPNDTGKKINNNNNPIGSRQPDGSTWTVKPLIRYIDPQYGPTYEPMEINATSCAADGKFEVHRVPLSRNGQNVVLGVPIPKEYVYAQESAYYTHIGLVRDGVLIGGSTLNRGGKGGDNPPPPRDIYLGSVSKIVKQTVTHEENIVISLPDMDHAIVPITGRVVSGNDVITYWPGLRAVQLITDPGLQGIWPMSPGLPFCSVRAVFNCVGAARHTMPVPCSDNGHFTIYVPANATDIIIECVYAPANGTLRRGTHVWPAAVNPAGAPDRPIDFTNFPPPVDNVLCVIWGMP